MSTHATPATAATTPRHALVNAKSVGWALTAITAASLLLGLAVVQILGRQTPPLDVEKEPPPAARRPAPTEHAKPIILENAATPAPGAGLPAPPWQQPRDSGARFGTRDTSLQPGVR